MPPATVTPSALTPTTIAPAARSAMTSAVAARDRAIQLTICTARSGLLELEERAAEVLRMEEQHGLAVRADLGLPAPKHTRTRRDQSVLGGADVVDLVADVVDAAFGVPLQERGDGRALAQGLEKLDLGVRQGDEDDGDPVLRVRHGCRDVAPQRVAVYGARPREVLHGDRDMVEAADHGCPLGRILAVIPRRP